MRPTGAVCWGEGRFSGNVGAGVSPCTLQTMDPCRFFNLIDCINHQHARKLPYLECSTRWAGCPQAGAATARRRGRWPCATPPPGCTCRAVDAGMCVFVGRIRTKGGQQARPRWPVTYIKAPLIRRLNPPSRPIAGLSAARAPTSRSPGTRRATTGAAPAGPGPTPCPQSPRGRGWQRGRRPTTR